MLLRFTIACLLMLATCLSVFGPAAADDNDVHGRAVVLVYELSFDDYYTGTHADAPSHPLVRLEGHLADWLKAYQQRKGYMKIGWLDRHSAPAYQASAELWLDSDVEAREVLVKAVASDLGLTPKVFSGAGFEADRHPQTAFADRLLIANGNSLRLDELDDAELLGLRGFIGQIPNWRGVQYVANMELGPRLPLAKVVALRFNKEGDIVITDLPVQLELGEIQVPSYIKTWSFLVGANELDLPVDVSAQLKAELISSINYMKGRFKAEKSDPNRHGVAYIFDLPEGSQTPPEGLETGLQSFYGLHPEFAPRAELAAAVESAAVPDSNQWRVILWTSHLSFLSDELSSCLASTGLTFKSVPLPPDMGGRKVVVSLDPGGKPRRLVNMAYMALPSMYWMNARPEFSKLSPELTDAAKAKADAMEQAFRAWAEQHKDLKITMYPPEPGSKPEVYPSEADIEFTRLDLEGVSVQIQVRWQLDDRGLYEDLKSRLSLAAGVSEPDVENGGWEFQSYPAVS